MEEIQEEQVQYEKKGSRIDVQAQMDKAELFMDKNKKQVYYILGALAVIIGGYLAYRFWYMPSQEAEAQKAAYYSFMLFEKDSLDKAIKGGEKIRTADNKTVVTPGLTKVADEYSGTKAGNLATYQLGCAYMQQGKFDKAIEMFEGFKSSDIIVSAIAIGAIGDCNMELNKTDEAIKYYLKAADKNSNNFTSPIYLKKAGLAYETKNQYAEALKVYERIQREYGKTKEGSEIVKYITRVKQLGNL
jgi:pentatricopeptide repeat protein